MNNDLISREALRNVILNDRKLDGANANWEVNRILVHIENAPTVAVDEEIERQREELYQESKKLFDTARMLGVERPQGEELANAIKAIRAVCKDNNDCNICPMNCNCNVSPDAWIV